jgi:hypothetical protein
MEILRHEVSLSLRIIQSVCWIGALQAIIPDFLNSFSIGAVYSRWRLSHPASKDHETFGRRGTRHG